MQLKKGYKQTELGIIPEDWEEMELNLITDKDRPISYGIVQTGNPVIDGVKCIRVVDLINVNIDDENLITTTKEISNSYKRTVLREGDLVIALRGKIGELSVINKNLVGANLTRGVALIAVKTEMNNLYVRHQINSGASKRILENRLNGSALKELSLSVLRKVPIILPPTKAEQTAIATALSDMDALITGLQKGIEKKKAIKQGAMQQLLKPKEGWVVKKLGEIAEIATGTTPPTNDLDNYGNEYCFVSPADLGAVKYVVKTEKNLSKKGFNLSRKFPANTILFTCIGSTIGKSAISHMEMTSNQQINAIFPNSTYSTEFVYYSLSLIAEQIKKSASEQAVPMINKTEFEKVLISLPTIEEQEQIASILSDMDAEIAQLESNLSKYKLLKQGMMQQLLTGKIRLV